jgi:protease-4
MTRRPTAIIVFALAATLGACQPITVSTTIGQRSAELREATVLHPGAREKVAMVTLTGLIASTPEPTLLGGRANTVDRVVRQLRKAERDPRVRAVILRIDSPGGAVTASDTLYSELLAFRERSGKPIVASLGDVAASGGYYVALAADRIIAHPTTITGSVGVIIPIVNINAGMARLGIEARPIVSGPNKDIGNPLTPTNPEHEAILQGLVDTMHTRFRGLVSARRQLEGDALDRVTDGRVLLGSAAVEAGLVDATGDIEDALADAARLAGLERARLIRYYSDQRPATPYADARAPMPVPASLAEAVRAAIPGSALKPGTPYYVWTAATTP